MVSDAAQRVTSADEGVKRQFGEEKMITDADPCQAKAVRLAREAVQERPSMPLGHSLLAQGLLESGRTAEAVEVMETWASAEVSRAPKK